MRVWKYSKIEKNWYVKKQRRNYNLLPVYRTIKAYFSNPNGTNSFIPQFLQNLHRRTCNARVTLALAISKMENSRREYRSPFACVFSSLCAKKLVLGLIEVNAERTQWSLVRRGMYRVQRRKGPHGAFTVILLPGKRASIQERERERKRNIGRVHRSKVS